VNQKYLPLREVVRVSLMLAAPAVGACVVLPWVLGYMGLGGRNGPYIAGLAVICLAVWLASSCAFASVMARPFRRAMRDLGHNVCIGCGYSRDGLESRTRCPECGEEPEG
jgi:apolipoprotein N-acyltransferase